MPELPEVEIVKRGLNRVIEQEHPLRVSKITLLRPDLRWSLPRLELQKLVGADLENVDRRAKFLIFQTGRGRFISHLGMTGNWRIEKADFSVQKHDHVILEFEQGLSLIYQDPRRFGFIIMEQSKRWRSQLSALGPEPLESGFSADYLWNTSRKKQTSVKSFLMSQKTVVGVGNIYASEALFFAGIRPDRLASKLSREQCEQLVAQVKTVLQKSLLAGGSTISDFRHVDQIQGHFQDSFQVYGRAGEICRKCGTFIKSKKLVGRSSFWCSGCQK